VNCIRLHGSGSSTVMLDPFLGIGHAAIAARICNVRRFFGFDIDPEYVRIARSNVRTPQPTAHSAQAVGEPQLFPI